MNKAVSAIENALEVDGKITISPKGKSMLPFLKEGRDSVVIIKPQSCLNKNDIVLYRDKTGEYVLHRIVKKQGDNILICGDNCSKWEKGYTQKDIIGVVKKVIRNGKEHNVHSEFYRIYEAVWCGTFFKRVIFKIKRMIKKKSLGA